MPQQAEDKAEIRTRRNRVKGRLAVTQPLCPGCMARFDGRGDGHHLFVRRGPDIPELYDPINIILAHNRCHTHESTGIQYRAARMKLDTYGPDAIEAWVESLPFKEAPDLPEFYWAAKEDWLHGV